MKSMEKQPSKVYPENTMDPINHFGELFIDATVLGPEAEREDMLNPIKTIADLFKDYMEKRRERKQRVSQQLAKTSLKETINTKP